MIEMIYRGTSKNNGQESRKALPKNIRQIGDMGRDTRVYIEDYAATFLEGTEYAILLGEIWQNGTMKCFFVDGALKVEPENFGDNMWEGVYRDAKEYFPGKEILGWAQKTESAEEAEDETLNIHREQFPGEDRLFVLHDMEGECGIYLTETTGIKKQPGYCLYYEKNEQMQNYMVRENEGKTVEAKEDVPDRAIKSFRKLLADRKDAMKKEEQEEVRSPLTVRFLYGASMFLVLTILVIGVTMINNYNRMKDMEMALSEMAAAETERLVVNDEVSLAVSAGVDTAEATLQEMTEGTEETAQTPESAAQGAVTGTDTAPADVTQTGTVQPGTTQTGTEPSETAQTDGTAQTGTVGETGDTEQQESDTQNRAAEASSLEVRKMQAEYTVREGDTLATVCRMYYGNLDKLEDICVLNDISDPNTILPGQKIVLP